MRIRGSRIEEEYTMKAKIALHGCDDITRFEVEVDDNKLEFIKELSEKSIEESEYACMPVLKYEICE
jgi:hypothetical protein